MPVEPTDFDDNRLAQIRLEQKEDQIVQYYIVNTDLKMSIGKICAQIAHGAQMFCETYQKYSLNFKAEQLKSFLASLNENPELVFVEEDYNHIVTKWRNTSVRKVVLGGTQKDFDKIKEQLTVFLVRDAGLTEIEPNSETVLVTWPIYRSECPKILKRLQTLK